MLNKKVVFTAILLLSSNIFANKIIAIGQVGENFVYKINGVLTSLPVGSIVDGCVVKASSGLQCDESFGSEINNLLAKNTQERQEKLKTIEKLSQENKKLTQATNDLNQDNQKLKKAQQQYAEQIHKYNKIITTLNNKINSINAQR